MKNCCCHRKSWEKFEGIQYCSSNASVLAARGIVLVNCVINRAEQIGKDRPGKRHGLRGAVIKCPVGSHQEHTGLIKKSWLAVQTRT